MISEDKITEIFCIADDFCKEFEQEYLKKSISASAGRTRHRSFHNFIMNLLAALGAYCFYSVKPHVNFDFEIPESDGQPTIW